jgi:hypothetical protein
VLFLFIINTLRLYLHFKHSEWLKASCRVAARFPPGIDAASAADNPSWEQAMNGPDRDGYFKAAEIEVETLERMDTWEVVEKEGWMNVLPTTWAFKCKRYPDGTIRKFKARFCARGDKQIEGVDFFETFAPVVNWTTVRLLLILSQVLNLSTKQVDYTAAFIHAPLHESRRYIAARNPIHHVPTLHVDGSVY